jgi:heme A synthase
VTRNQIYAAVALVILVTCYICWTVGALTSDSDLSDKLANCAFIALFAYLVYSAIMLG